MMTTSRVMAGCILGIWLGTLPTFGADAETARPETETPPFFFRLTDGTRLLCAPAIERIPFVTAYAEMNIAWSNVTKIAFQRKEQKAVLSLRNGDLLQGSIPLTTMRVRALIGELTIPMTNVEEIAFNGAVDLPSAAAPLNDTPQARNACINTLRQIDGAKEQWAMENNRADGDRPGPNDISPYIRNGFQALHCPSGGTLSINALGAAPTCTVPGHTIR